MLTVAQTDGQTLLIFIYRFKNQIFLQFRNFEKNVDSTYTYYSFGTVVTICHSVVPKHLIKLSNHFARGSSCEVL